MDEIIYLDITRDGLYDLGSVRNVIGSSSSKARVCKRKKKYYRNYTRSFKICRVPLIIGGKIRSLNDIKLRLKAGADKVVINTAAIDDPEFIKKHVRNLVLNVLFYVLI